MIFFKTKTLVNKYTTRCGSSWLSSYIRYLYLNMYNTQIYTYMYIYIYRTNRIRRTPKSWNAQFQKRTSHKQLSEDPSLLFRLPMMRPCFEATGHVVMSYHLKPLCLRVACSPIVLSDCMDSNAKSNANEKRWVHAIEKRIEDACGYYRRFQAR